MDNRAIGFFDSGIGGLTTLAAVRHVLPNEKYIYYADNANAPYGDLCEEQIFAHTSDSVNILLSNDVKVVVLACNTATKVCVKKLREQTTIPIFGLEPALKPAARLQGKTLVLTTPATYHSASFQSLLLKYGKDMHVLPMRELAKQIEEQPNQLMCIAKSIGVDLTLYDNLVLGCTHYVFLRGTLQTIYPHLSIFDGNSGLALHLYRHLQSQNLLATNDCSRVDILNSKLPSEHYYSLLKNISTLGNLCQ